VDESRQMMRRLYMELAGIDHLVIEAMAQAIERGEVTRPPSAHSVSHIEYAVGLWRDGVRRGWLNE
jgi:hypothetical protein